MTPIVLATKWIKSGGKFRGQSDLRDRRLIPYLSLHEFEALLFTSPETLTRTLSAPIVLRQLTAMVDAVTSPEEINDGPSTHPSARIKSLLPAYSKRLHGPLIARRICLDEIRRQCPHFNRWVTRLEGIGAV